MSIFYNFDTAAAGPDLHSYCSGVFMRDEVKALNDK